LGDGQFTLPGDSLGGDTVSPQLLTESRRRCNPDCMTGNKMIPPLIIRIAEELHAHGIVITCLAGEWRVNFRGGTDATAYVTDDLQDAFDHGRAMVLAGQSASAEPARYRHKWHRPRSAKEQRRRMIRQHNRRTRARALRRS
jgi:hypothetical protein